MGLKPSLSTQYNIQVSYYIIQPGMNSNSRFQREINRHINFWFHTPKQDSISPRETITQFCDTFLKGVKTLGFWLSVDENQFRRYMCEAICIMYEAKKRDIDWRGPLTDALRPDGWTAKHEAEWREILTYRYFNSEFFESIWRFVEQGLWESYLSDWRLSFEHIVIHYIAIRHNLMENGSQFDHEDGPDDYYSE